MTTNPTRYRHRTTEIEAVQWTGDNADALRAFCGPDFEEIELDDRVDDPDETAAVREARHNTWRGLKPGDWVVRLDGGLYEFAAEDFARQYEPAPVASADLPAPVDRADVYREVADRLAADAEKGEKEGFTRIYQRAAATKVREWAADGPLSPYYQHPACGFHWHGKDGMDVPLRDGQPVCPRCELRRLAGEAQQTRTPATLTPCTCRQAVHAREHKGQLIPGCPWCTATPDIRPNRTEPEQTADLPLPTPATELRP